MITNIVYIQKSYRYDKDNNKKYKISMSINSGYIKSVKFLKTKFTKNWIRKHRKAKHLLSIEEIKFII